MSLQFQGKVTNRPEFQDDSHPLYIFFQGNVQDRSDVILNHPDVTGFIYLHDGVVRKAFLPKKVINFKATSAERRNAIVAVSGDPEEYTPFSVSESELFSDTFHLTDCATLNKKTPFVPVGKFIKEHDKHIKDLPDEYNTDSKIKKLKIASFPLVLPIIQGYEFEEGEIEDENIRESLLQVHDLYAEWVFLFQKSYIVDSCFTSDKITWPTPEVRSITTAFHELPIKVLFKTTNKDSPYNIIKQHVDNFIQANRQENKIEKTSVPEVVNLSEDKTLASKIDSSVSSVMNDRLTAFLQILFAKPSYDRYGKLLSLTPATISDDLQEIFQAASSISLQARMVHDAIRIVADEVTQEKYYLSRAAKFPFLSSTLITYALQAHYHTEAIDTDFESLKKSFSILALLAPPREGLDEYQSFINSSKNVDVDRMLDQPDEKRAIMRKDIFIKGRQHSIEDIITFIANIQVYSRFWVKITTNDLNDYPYVIQMFIDVANFLSSSEYIKFDDKYRIQAPYMYHTLVCYIFNIFSTFVRMAKNPINVRKLKIENTIDIKELRVGQLMHHNLLDQLKICSATSSLQILFAGPSYSYKMFFPDVQPKHSKRPLLDDGKPNYLENKKRKTYGPIVNKTGKRITFPKGLEKRYCAEFLDANEFCPHGDKCSFSHAPFPGGFSVKDKELMIKHVRDTDGLSFKDKHVS